MRQAQDVEYRQMMYFARHVCFNTNDITTLNQKMITSFDLIKLNNVIVIIKRNIIRHMINRNQMKSFAIKHNQKIIIFSTHHNRLSTHEINIDELLNCSNHIKMSSAELFFYIKNASIIFFSNLNFTFRLINDCRDYMNDIILDSENKNFNSNLNFDMNNILFQIICITLIHCIISAQNHRYVCIYKNQEHLIMNLKT
jgi:hypothetical protein